MGSPSSALNEGGVRSTIFRTVNDGIVTGIVRVRQERGSFSDAGVGGLLNFWGGERKVSPTGRKVGDEGNHFVSGFHFSKEDVHPFNGRATFLQLLSPPSLVEYHFQFLDFLEGCRHSGLINHEFGNPVAFAWCNLLIGRGENQSRGFFDS